MLVYFIHQLISLPLLHSALSERSFGPPLAFFDGLLPGFYEIAIFASVHCAQQTRCTFIFALFCECGGWVAVQVLWCGKDKGALLDAYESIWPE